MTREYLAYAADLLCREADLSSVSKPPAVWHRYLRSRNQCAWLRCKIGAYWDAPVWIIRIPRTLYFGGCIEQVRWTGGAEQACPADGFVPADMSACDVQADALESV